MEITYFYNSGFAVMIDKTLLVFDYYVDSEKRLPELIDRAEKIYFFASHWHGDHFSTKIFNWEQKASAYILSSDIRDYVPDTEANIIWMNPYEKQDLDEITVRTFGSTDEGVSFAIEAGGYRLFHAGDLNWWHWKEDTEENQAQAKQAFFEEMAHLDGEVFDVAFFPVDARLEECRAWGIAEFCRHVTATQIVAMHIHQIPWTDAEGSLRRDGYEPNVWCPTNQGEVLKLDE